jgi:hypothetical protein
MTVPSQDSFESRAVRLGGATPQFQRMADDLVRQVRRAMGVPDQAEPEVELEFAGLRQSLDAFYPEFTKIFADLLASYLGHAGSVALTSLENEVVQAYVQVAEQIEDDVAVVLHGYVPRISAALSPDAAPS